MRYKNNLISLIIGITLAITALLLFVPVLNRFFEFGNLTAYQIMIASGVGFIAVIWYEFVKLSARFKNRI